MRSSREPTTTGDARARARGAADGTPGAAGDAPRPLEGFTVGVTADRRRQELVTLLERRGARVVEAPALRIVPLPDDEKLLAATRAVLAASPDLAVATTGVGFRGWMAAAEGWGLGEELREKLAGAVIVTRGPKATGAVRAAGLSDAWSPASEAMAELAERLLAAEELDGRTVVLQEHGEPLPWFTDAIRAAGARVIEVPVYRWVMHSDRRPLEKLVEAACANQLDAVAFTSAPAVTNLFRVAGEGGRAEELSAALRNGVLAACVGPVCAAPLDEREIPSVRPAHARLGALVRTIVEELPPRRSRSFSAGGHSVVVRGHTVVVDGRSAPVSPSTATVLRVLVDHPGRVLSPSELLELAWREPADKHAVETAVARLRRALGPAAPAVSTVVKRGYRLDVD